MTSQKVARSMRVGSASMSNWVGTAVVKKPNFGHSA